MIYPISFVNNDCCHCGGRNTLRFEQENGSIVKDPIYGINSIYCKKCLTKFFIKWIPDSKDETKMVPIATSFETIGIFENDIIEYSKQYKRKLDFGGLEE